MRIAPPAALRATTRRAPRFASRRASPPPARPSSRSVRRRRGRSSSISARRATSARRQPTSLPCCARRTRRTPARSRSRRSRPRGLARPSTTDWPAPRAAWAERARRLAPRRRARTLGGMTAPVPADVISRLKSVLGEDGWSTDPERLAPKLVEWRDRWSGSTPLLALPRSTTEVAAVVGVCAESGTAIAPQGGNTGLVGGQIPDGEILLSLERMRAVREVNAADDVLMVEAGLTLAEAHDAATAVGRRFPLSLASEGSCTIGGLVSTNAGGVAVLRYGTMRQLVLGLEAVLPNGEVWNGLKRLRKDNTGYDLKQLLIGGEGTLGVVTAAALKLFPLLGSRAVAFAGVGSPA